MKSDDITRARRLQSQSGAEPSRAENELLVRKPPMPTPDKNDATILLRLPAELKALLVREAAINGRRITSEVNLRLKKSFEQLPPNPGTVRGLLPSSYTERGIVPAQISEPTEEDRLSDTERAMLGVFRRLPPEKQLALLSLFK